MPITVLLPSLKDGYFEDAGWENDWVETARQLLRDVFNEHYRGRFGPEQPALAQPASDQPDAAPKVRRMTEMHCHIARLTFSFRTYLQICQHSQEFDVQQLSTSSSAIFLSLAKTLTMP